MAEITPPLPAPEHKAEPLLTERFVQDVFAAVAAKDQATLFSLIDSLSKEDFADLIELCQPEQRDALLGMVKPQLDSDVLLLLDENIREDVVEQMDSRELAAKISDLDTDDAAGIMETMEEDVQREVLSALPASERDALRTVMSYPEDSAGRLMQQDFIAVPDTWKVSQAIAHIRTAADKPEAFYDIFVVDEFQHARGAVPLHNLLTAAPETALTAIMDERSQRIPITMEQKEVAYIFHRYGLVCAPVEDDQHRVVGMITIDDVIDIIEERATEELVHLSGVSEPDFYRDIMETARSRFTWLFVNLLTALLASKVIAQFEHTIEVFATVALVMPIVASQGGNAGIQTLATAVRGLALRELTSLNAWRFVRKEMVVGAINGVLFAVIVGIVIGLWFHNWLLALALSFAMIINLTIAGLVGAVLPLGLYRLKQDPAAASSGLVTMVTDCCGFGVFLALATLFLLH